MPILGIIASSFRSAAGPEGAYDALATVTLSSTASSIAFAGIPSGYKHLQIRFMNPAGATTGDIHAQFNGDTGSNYHRHYLLGTGSAAAAGASGTVDKVSIGYGANTSGTFPAIGIVDILDYANTNKNKVTRALSGQDLNGSGNIFYFSGLWMNTSAITSINIFNGGSNNFVANTSIALYGVK